MDIQPTTRSLTIGYVFSLLLLTALGIGSFIYMQGVIRDDAASANQANIGGQQQLLIRKISLLARHILHDYDTGSGTSTREALIESIDLLEKSHNALAHGDPLLNLPATMSADIKALYFGPRGFLEKQMYSYLQHASSLVEAPDDEIGPDNPDLRYLTNKAPEELLDTLKAVVAQYQLEGEQAHTVLRRTYVLVLLAILSVLFFLGLGIFRPMIRRIRYDFTERSRTEGELKDKAALVELLHRTATVANEAESFEDAVRICLVDLCTYKNWPVGHAYILDSEPPTKLIPTDIWYLEDATRFRAFLDVTKKTTFEPGIGLPGRVLATGQPAWIVDVTKDPNFPRARLERDIEIKGGFGLPVLVGSKVMAVLEFFTEEAEEPDRSLMGVLRHIGTQLGRVIERQQSADALRYSERRKKEILQSALDAIVTIDKTGRVVEFNPAAEIIFQYRNSDVVGKNIADLIIPPHLREKHLKGFERYMTTGKSQILGRRLEMTAIRSNKSEFPVELTVMEVDTGDDRVFTAFIRDITTRRQAEEESREHRAQLAHASRLSVIGEMAAGLAHELNQPLTAISGYLGGALRTLRPGDEVTEETIQAADKALQQASRAGEIIQWLRNFIKKEAGEKTFFDVHDAIDLVVELAEVKARKSRVAIKSTLDRSLPWVLADPIQIQQLLLNLIWNAIEAMDKGPRTQRTLTIRTAMPDDRSILVSIHNTGPVIPPEAMDRIFNPFFTTKAEGIGLGLTICQSIVEDHDGRLWATSDAKTGTTFNFTLPVVEEDESVDR